MALLLLRAKFIPQLSSASKCFAFRIIVFLHLAQCYLPMRRRSIVSVPILQIPFLTPPLRSVYLSVIHSLHTKEGLADPLVGCLQLQRVLQGIKRHQGSHQPKHQPITSDLLKIICHSMDPMEFTVNSPFNSDNIIHLAVDNIQADSLLNPRSFRIFIKYSKTDPFHQGCCVDNGTSSSHL